MKQLVSLIGPDGKPTNQKYKVINKNAIEATVEDVETNQELTIHVSRIMSKEQHICKCGKKCSSLSGLTLHMKNCQEGSDVMAKAAAAPKEAKESKKSVDGFDLSAFIKDNGGEHWQSQARKFDHAGYELITHAVMDEKAGFYYIINTYTYPDGTVSLGRNGKGVTKYPLKGKSVSYTISQTAKKVESRGEKRTRKGSKAADDIRKHWEKQSYTKA